MADLTKFLADDHARIRRSFHEYRRTPSNIDAALNVCDTIWIHLTIEVELVPSEVWNDLPAGDAEAMSHADDQVHQLMTAIDRLDANDTSLARRMVALSQALDGHIAAYEKFILPKLATRPDELELGQRAFRRWQELFAEKTPRTWRPMDRLANTGWGGGGKMANSGW